MSLLSSFIHTFSDEYRGMKLDLNRIRSFLDSIQNPEKKFPSILIAGTNGKGSVARMLESILSASGYKTGLYTSPHLIRFSERIRIAGQELREDELEKILSKFQDLKCLDAEGLLKTPSGEALTWFEKVTALAFAVFAEKKIDIAILEVGLGGRLDATNVVDPTLSIITSISLDHTEILGPSLFDIAREKLGVARPGKPLLLGNIESAVRNFLIEGSRLLGSIPLSISKPKGSASAFFYRDWGKLELNLQGQHQLQNAALALEAVTLLREQGWEIPLEAVQKGLSQVSHPGRLQWVSQTPPILLDGAHNEESLKALLDYLQHFHADKKWVFLMAMMKEKKYRKAIRDLKKSVTRFVFTSVDSPRSLQVEDWQVLVEAYGLKAEFFAIAPEAFQNASQNLAADEILVVTGSLYLVGEIQAILKID